MAYVGVYSSPPPPPKPGQVDFPPGNGRGIHMFKQDPRTGLLEPAGIYADDSSPTSLAVHPRRTHLYSANRTSKGLRGDAGSVTAFAIDAKSGALRPLNTVSSVDAGPAHMSIHRNGQWVFVANYAGSSVAVFPVKPDGSIGEASDVKKTSGTVGPKFSRNAPPGSFAFSGHDFPHSHMMELDPSGRFVLSTDLALDRIFIWRFDDQKGAVTPHEPPSVALPPGDGPRHFAFHPNGRWLYSLQEEGANIVHFDYDATAGRLTARKMISSLPPGFAGSCFTSAILVSRDGRFVYAANRLHESIGIFSVGPAGELTFVDAEWTRGSYTRSFNFDPSGNYMYVCNQRADNVTVFQVDRPSGRLRFTGQYLPVGNPSVIEFVQLDKRG